MDPNKDDIIKDPFLERIIPKLPVEGLSGDFTSQVMNQIYASVEPELEPTAYRKQMLWAYGSIAAGIAIIALILFAIWPFFEINLRMDSAKLFSLLSATMNIFEKISSLTDYLKDSSVFLSIFFSVAVLFLVERLLRRKVSTDNSFL
jgi:hypothetical protein